MALCHLLITSLGFVSLVASTNPGIERTILFQDHGSDRVLPELSKPVQSDTIEVTSQQTRTRKQELAQWRIPFKPHDSHPSTNIILQNETTLQGWLTSHSSWILPITCEQVKKRPGNSYHDANLVFGNNGQDFSGGGNPLKVIHPVCIPNSVFNNNIGITSSPIISNDYINLHGQICGPAKCIKNNEILKDEIQCKKALITEPDLPSVHYVSDISIRGISNIYLKESPNLISSFNPKESVGLSSEDQEEKNTNNNINDKEKEFISHDKSSLLGYTKVCSLNDWESSYVYTNPLNGYKYTRAAMRVKGTIHGIQSSFSRYNKNNDNDSNDGSDMKGNDIDNDCENTKAISISNALVEIWQADGLGRYDKNPISPLTSQLLEQGILFSNNSYLSSGECRGALRSDTFGQYMIDTEVPASTGPPQRIHFRVSAPGFKTLTTSLYLGDDPAWFSLVQNPDAKRALLKNPNVVKFENNAGARIPQGSSLSSNNENLKNHHKTSSSSSSNLFEFNVHNDGYEIVFNITLDSINNDINNKKVKNSQHKSGALMNSFNGNGGELDGIWLDASSSSSSSSSSISSSRSNHLIQQNHIQNKNIVHNNNNNNQQNTPGFVLVETNGIHVKFTEVPKIRKWGTTEALLIGGKLRYADFRDRASPLLYPSSSSSSSSSSMDGILAQDATLSSDGVKGGGGIDTGMIITTSHSMNNVGSGAGMSIHWGGGKGAWFKQPNPLRFRFLKLTMYGSTRQSHGGVFPQGHFLNINEIAFYQGFTKLSKVNFQTTDEGHVQAHGPKRVTCSSAQETNPCWFAFDGESSHSWRTEDGGFMKKDPSNDDDDDIVEKPYGTTSYFEHEQWIEVDFGELTPSKWILPSAMAILCDAEPLGGIHEHEHKGEQRTPHDDSSEFSNDKTMAYRDCPRSFMLQGSNDGLFYQDIYKRGGVGDWLTADYYTEAASLKNDFELKRGQNKGWPTKDVLHESGRVQGAAFFDFSHAHMSSGRDNGARCGSCDIPSSSSFSSEGCTYDGFDSTCSSAYCDKRGLCAPQTEMTCPLGYYLSNAAENNTFHINEEEYPSPLDRSMKESIMKKERVGGGVEKEDDDDVLLYSTGRTSFDGDASITSSSKCLKCAEGYYGNHLWYRSLLCHGQCHAGYYCPEGSTSGYAYKCGHDNVYCPKGSGAPFIVSNGYYSVGGHNSTVRTHQLPCVPGTYCHKGVKYDCPAGTYGLTSKLTNNQCSGLCERGHYCPKGSISSTELPCPAGRFGNSTGLTSSKCSGSCLRNYRCREGSTDKFGEGVNTGDA